MLIQKNLHKALKKTLLILLFGGALSLSFLDKSYFYLTWFAFIPLLFAIERSSPIVIYIIGLLSGLVLFIGGMYWIVDFISIAKDTHIQENLGLAFIYWLYCAHLIAFMLLLFNWLRKNTKVHEFILFPIIVSIFTSSYPMLFSIYLGESQTSFLISLQAIEFLGTYSLDAIIALVNIVFFRLIANIYYKPSERKKYTLWSWATPFIIICLWFGYGLLSFNKWSKDIKNWETLTTGLVQPNEAPTVGKKIIYPGYSRTFPPEIDMTQRLASLGAEIVIWPEGQKKGYLNNKNINNAYRQTAKEMDTYILFQDIHLKNQQSKKEGYANNQYNAAIMLDNKGEQIGRYNKLKRIPFGEYIPILDDDSILKQWISNFLGNFLNEFSKGESHQLFIHSKTNIIPLICYETTFPTFVGQAIQKTQNKADQTKGSILIGLSNDGWFGSTHQPYQHIMGSVLRAVENRLPLVHVANNGPSIVVNPTGQIIFTSDFQQAGGYIVDVPYFSDAQGSFYSRHPTLFTNILYGLLSALCINALANIFRLRFTKPRFS